MKEVKSNNILNILENLMERYKNYNNIVTSCIFSNSKILSYGISKPDVHLHSIGNNKQYSIHAEIDAVSNFYRKYKKNQRNKFNNINILTIRVNKENKIVLAKSCKCCVISLKKFNFIKNIYYSDNDMIYCENLNELYENKHLLNFSSGDRRRFLN